MESASHVVVATKAREAMVSESPYLNAREAAEYVKAPSIGAFDTWCWRYGVRPDARRGRLRLFLPTSLDRILRLKNISIVSERRA